MLNGNLQSEYYLCEGVITKIYRLCCLQILLGAPCFTIQPILRKRFYGHLKFVELKIDITCISVLTWWIMLLGRSWSRLDKLLGS